MLKQHIVASVLVNLKQHIMAITFLLLSLVNWAFISSQVRKKNCIFLNEVRKEVEILESN